MCGLAGIYNYSNEQEIKETIESFDSLLKHRGPDGKGSYFDDKYLVAHRRLAIVNSDSNSDQPFYSKCRRYNLSFNGEIYNYLELAQELKDEGIVLSTTSDTEVLLESYLFWGTSFLDKVNGMFAIAIWDSVDKKLFIARDRLGIKPLYYAHDGKSFVFSSEIRPILKVIKKCSLNYESLSDYFRFRYIQGDATAFKEVKCLSPGSYMIASGTEFTHKKYWSLQEAVKSPQSLNLEKLEEIYKSSIHLRMRSHSKIGSYLSSGIDSSSLLFANSETQRIHSTYTFDTEDSKSEVKEAKRISTQLNIRHTEVKKKSNYRNLSTILKNLEEPIGDNIILASNDLAHMASKDVKVILSGEGADEILNGYAHHYVLYILSKFKFLTKIIGHAINFLPLKFINYIHPYPREFDRRTIQSISSKLTRFENSKEYIQSFTELFSNEDLSTFLKSSFYNKLSNRKASTDNEFRESNFINKLTLHDLENWNVKYTLLRSDKINMSHSLEARVPFMDHRLVEYIYSLKIEDRIGLREQKIPLKRLMKRLGAPKAIWNKKKAPFLVSLSNEREYIEFQTFCEEELTSTMLKDSPFWNCEEVLELINKKRSRSFVEDKQLFSILAFQSWFNEFEEFGLSI